MITFNRKLPHRYREWSQLVTCDSVRYVLIIVCVCEEAQCVSFFVIIEKQKKMLQINVYHPIAAGVFGSCFLGPAPAPKNVEIRVNQWQEFFCILPKKWLPFKIFLFLGGGLFFCFWLFKKKRIVFALQEKRNRFWTACSELLYCVTVIQWFQCYAWYHFRCKDLTVVFIHIIPIS